MKEMEAKWRLLQAAASNVGLDWRMRRMRRRKNMLILLLLLKKKYEMCTKRSKNIVGTRKIKKLNCSKFAEDERGRMELVVLVVIGFPGCCKCSCMPTRGI